MSKIHSWATEIFFWILLCTSFRESDQNTIRVQIPSQSQSSNYQNNVNRSGILGIGGEGVTKVASRRMLDADVDEVVVGDDPENNRLVAQVSAVHVLSQVIVV